MTSQIKKILKTPLSSLIYSFILAFSSSWPAFFLVRLEFLTQNSLLFWIAVGLGAFVIMFLIPIFIVRFIWNKPVTDFGLRLPELPWQALKLSLIIVLLSLPALFFFATKTSFQEYYLIKEKFNFLFILAILANIIYYFSEEFLFRGFLLFGLFDKLKFHSFWITNLTFALFHLGKPFAEVPFAFALGMGLSYLSYKTKSFLPGVVVHIIMASILNTMIVFTS